MFSKIFRRRMAKDYQLFNAQYIDPRGLFLYFFDKVPNISYVTNVDVNQAYPFIMDKVGGHVQEVYQHAQLNDETRALEFNVTFVVLRTDLLIEIGGDYVSVLHGRQEADWVAQMLKDLAAFRAHHKTGTHKIGFATQNELN